jgi:hypothetical protein
MGNTENFAVVWVEITELQQTLHAQYTDIFILNVCNKFHMSVFNSSLVVSIKKTAWSESASEL